MRSLFLFVLVAIVVGMAACTEQSNPLSTDKDSVGNEDDVALSKKEAKTFYDITTFSASLGGTASAGNGLDNQGRVVGSSNLPGDDHAHAALWRNGVLVDLGTLGGPNSSVAWPGQNDKGMIVGISETPALGGENWACRFFFPSSTGHQCVGFVWQDGVMTKLPTWPGGTNGFATGVNNRGQVVGWAENGVEDPTCNSPVVHQFRGVLWDTRTSTMKELSPLSGDSTSSGTAINDRGQVVGISGDCSNAVGGFSARNAVLWERDGTAIDIGNLGGKAWHTPMDINNRGDIVGFGNPAGVPGDAFGIHAFLWTRHGGIKDLGVLEGDATSQALGINEHRQVVGLSRGPEGDRAVLWERGVMTNLNDLAPDYDGTLLYAGHINNRGVITGASRDQETNETLTFIATPQRGRR